jgi:hypothetical protein
VGTYSDICDQRYRTELDFGTSDIGLKRAEFDIISDIGINFYPVSDIRHHNIFSSAQRLKGKALAWERKGLRSISSKCQIFFGYRISEWTQMSISELFQYRNDRFQSDIFSSNIGITDVDVGCRISQTIGSMSMPTYAYLRANYIFYGDSP